jgi:YVTN family beta-propeller protein
MKLATSKFAATATLALAVSLAGACHKDPVAPVDPPVVPSHPAGNEITTVALSYRPYGLGVNAAGTAIVTRLDTTAATIFDVATRRIVRAAAVGTIPTSAAARGNVAYVTNQADRTISSVNLANGASSSIITLGADPLYLTLTKSGGSLLVTANDGNLRVYNSASHGLVATIAIGAQPNGIAVSGDTLAYVGAAFGGFVREVNLRTNTVGRTFNTTGTPQDVVLSKDGKTLFIANEGGGLDVFSVATAQRTAALPIGASFGAALTPDGQQLWVTQTDYGTVTVVDAATNAVLQTITTMGAPRRIAFDGTGLTAVVTMESGSVSFIH